MTIDIDRLTEAELIDLNNRIVEIEVSASNAGTRRNA
jgi:hypothetical protein